MTSVASSGAPADEPEEPGGLLRRPRTRWWPFSPVVLAVVVGFAATGVLTWVTYTSYTHNEDRLLRLRAGDVGTVLTSFLPSLQTSLATAAALADATDGNTAKFGSLVAPYVGKGRLFASVSLWNVLHPLRGPVAVVGLQPALADSAYQTVAFFREASTSPKLSVVGLMRSGRLGYGFTGPVPGPYAVYGESLLKPGRYAPVANKSAFSDLNFALYLGSSVKPASLLLASVRHPPLTGSLATVRVPFGDTYFTVVVASREPLAGALPQRLPWAIAIAGVLLTLAGGALALRLIERRRGVERLADRLEEVAEENRRLYREQRTIAQTLQHALLPDVLPEFPGLQVSARYEAGVDGVDIGGDWYDLFAEDDRRLLLVIGDVSGRGLRAAATIALLRFAIHAYHAQGDEPETFLPKLSGLVSVGADRQLATVLCVSIDVGGHRISVTNAGHLPPLLVSDEGSRFIESQVGLPVGVDREAAYASTTVAAPPGATLLAFTDGLVERRGESIEVGLDRLRSVVGSNHRGLEQLMEHVVADMRDNQIDDTAIAAIRWAN
jgi:serine phosphatase RsbU (regulator of sigma subunit)